MATVKRVWNPAHHPRDARGRFTKSATRVLKASDAKRAKAAISGFKPTDLGPAAANGGEWLTRQPAAAAAGDDAVARYFAGGWKETHQALRTKKDAASDPDVIALDKAVQPLTDDVMLERRVSLKMFAHIPLEQLQGMKVRDAAYQPTALQGSQGEAPDGMVTIHMAVPAGTRALVNPDTGAVVLDRDTETAISRVEPNGRGGWDLYGIVIPKQGSTRPGRPAGDEQQDDGEDSSAAPKPTAEPGTQAAPDEGSDTDTAGGSAAAGGTTPRKAAPAKKTAPPAGGGQDAGDGAAEPAPSATRKTPPAKKAAPVAGTRTPAPRRTTATAPAGGKVKAAELVDGDHIRATGDDGFGEQITRTGYQRGTPSPVQTGSDGRDMLALSIADAPDAPGRQMYVDPDAEVDRVTAGEDDDLQDAPAAEQAAEQAATTRAAAQAAEAAADHEEVTGRPAPSTVADLERNDHVRVGGTTIDGRRTSETGYVSTPQTIGGTTMVVVSQWPDGQGRRTALAVSEDTAVISVPHPTPADGEVVLWANAKTGRAVLDPSQVEITRRQIIRDPKREQRVRDRIAELSGQPTPSATGTPAAAVPAGPKLATMTAVDQAALGVAVEDAGPGIFQSPLAGGSFSDVGRYVGEGPAVRPLVDKYGADTVWGAAEEWARANPGVLARTPDEVNARRAERARLAGERSTAAAAAMKAGDYDLARTELDAGEALDPTHRENLRSWDEMRAIVARVEAKQAAPERSNPPAVSPAAGPGNPQSADVANPTRTAFGTDMERAYVMFGAGDSPSQRGRRVMVDQFGRGKVRVSGLDDNAVTVYDHGDQVWLAPRVDRAQMDAYIAARGPDPDGIPVADLQRDQHVTVTGSDGMSVTGYVVETRGDGDNQAVTLSNLPDGNGDRTELPVTADTVASRAAHAPDRSFALYVDDQGRRVNNPSQAAIKQKRVVRDTEAENALRKRMAEMAAADDGYQAADVDPDTETSTGTPAPVRRQVPAVVDPAETLAAKEQELQRVNDAFDALDYRPSGNMRTKSFGQRNDAALRRTAKLVADRQRLEREVAGLRRRVDAQKAGRAPDGFVPREQRPAYRKDYLRGWQASTRNTPGALEAADVRGESTAWYHGWEDFSVDNPKFASAREADAHEIDVANADTRYVLRTYQVDPATGDETNAEPDRYPRGLASLNYMLTGERPADKVADPLPDGTRDARGRAEVGGFVYEWGPTDGRGAILPEGSTRDDNSSADEPAVTTEPAPSGESPLGEDLTVVPVARLDRTDPAVAEPTRDRWENHGSPATGLWFGDGSRPKGRGEPASFTVQGRGKARVIMVRGTDPDSDLLRRQDYTDRMWIAPVDAPAPDTAEPTSITAGTAVSESPVVRPAPASTAMGAMPTPERTAELLANPSVTPGRSVGEETRTWDPELSKPRVVQTLEVDGEQIAIVQMARIDQPKAGDKPTLAYSDIFYAVDSDQEFQQISLTHFTADGPGGKGVAGQLVPGQSNPTGVPGGEFRNMHLASGQTLNSAVAGARRKIAQQRAYERYAPAARENIAAHSQADFDALSPTAPIRPGDLVALTSFNKIRTGVAYNVTGTKVEALVATPSNPDNVVTARAQLGVGVRRLNTPAPEPAPAPAVTGTATPETPPVAAPTPVIAPAPARAATRDSPTSTTPAATVARTGDPFRVLPRNTLALEDDLFGDTRTFQPGNRSSLGMAERADVGRTRGAAATQQLGMFAVDDPKGLEGQTALLDALLQMPEAPAPAPAALAPDAPEPTRVDVPDDLTGWSDEQLSGLFADVTALDALDEQADAGMNRIIGEWARREQEMSDLLARVPDDLSTLPDADVMSLYADLTSHHGTMNTDVVTRVEADLDRRDRETADWQAKRDLVALDPAAHATEDDLADAISAAADLDDWVSYDRLVTELDRRDREATTQREAAERDRLETERREAAAAAEQNAAVAAAAAVQAEQDNAEAILASLESRLAAPTPGGDGPALEDTPVGLENRIRDAYDRLSGGQETWVGLADLRDEIGDADRAAVDGVLALMARMPGVMVEEETNQKTLTQRDRDAAVNIGARDQHVIGISPDSPRASATGPAPTSAGSGLPANQLDLRIRRAYRTLSREGTPVTVDAIANELDGVPAWEVQNVLQMLSRLNDPDTRDMARSITPSTDAGPGPGSTEFDQMDTTALSGEIIRTKFSPDPTERAYADRAVTEYNRRKAAELRAQETAAAARTRRRLLTADVSQLTDDELRDFPALLDAVPAEQREQLRAGRGAQVLAEATRRQNRADAQAARKAAGPARPPRYTNPLERLAEVERRAQAGMGYSDWFEARRRLTTAQARAYGLPGDLPSGNDVARARRDDPRDPAAQATAVLGWYRHLAEFEQLDAGAPDWMRGFPDDPDVPDVIEPIPAVNIRNADTVLQAMLVQAAKDRDNGDDSGWIRYRRALARAYRIPYDPNDTSDQGLQTLGIQTTDARRVDPRTDKQQASATLAEWQRLATEDGVDPSDELRAGPAARGKSKTAGRKSDPVQEAQINALIAQGLPWIEAYAQVHQLDVDVLRRQETDRLIRDNATGTTSLTQAYRQHYDEMVYDAHDRAEQATRGHLLNDEGKKLLAAGRLTSLDLFSGSSSRAYKYASEELKRWWGENPPPRMTFAQWRETVQGDPAGMRAAIQAQKGNEFT